MDFSKVNVWEIPDGFVDKVVEKKTGKVLWEKFKSHIYVLDLSGHPDFTVNVSPLGWATGINGSNWECPTEINTVGDQKVYFSLTDIPGDASTLITDVNNKSMFKYLIFCENTGGAGSLIMEKYSNYITSGNTGTYTWSDIRSELNKSGLVWSECSFTTHSQDIFDPIALKNKTTKVNGEYLFYMIIGQDYYDYGSAISWTLTDMSVGSANNTTTSFDVSDDNMNCWRIETTVNWLDADITDACGTTSSIYLLIDANTSSSSRSGKVRLISEQDNSVIQEATITQAGANTTYSVSAAPSSLQILAAGGSNESTITASHPTQVTVASSNDWCTATYSSSTKKVTVKAAMNLSLETRTAKVTVMCGNKSAIINVTQDPYSELSVPSSINTQAFATSFSATLPISSPNRSFTYTSNLSGASVSMSKLSSNSLIIATTGANDGSSTKTLGTITITDGVLTKTVTVYQPYATISATLSTTNADGTEAMFDFSSSSTSKRISVNPGSIWKLTVTSNTTWRISIPTNFGWTIGDSMIPPYDGSKNETVILTAPSSFSTTNSQITITYGSSRNMTKGSFYFAKA